MSLSKRASGVVGSLTLKIDSVAKRMRAEGKDVIGFGSGEPDFNTPDYIIEAGKRAMDLGMTKYTPASGSLALKQAVCDKFLEDNGLEYAPDQIVISNGAKHSLHNVFQAILDPGDEVIIPSPYWVSYPEMVKLSGGVPVFVDTFEKDNFVALPKAIEKAITPKTKAIVINTPSNPCGGIYRRETLEQIARIALAKDVMVISDEIYEKIIYDGNEHISIASLGENIKKNTIVINGFSKAYAMTGWRLGYLAAEVEIAKAISRMQSHTTSNPNSMAQYAGLVALQTGKEQIDKMVVEFDERRKIMYEMINDMHGLHTNLPEGAFYMMANIASTLGRKYKGEVIEGSLDFARLLLEAKYVAVVPGIAFGADEYVRFSYAIDKDNMIDGLNRIEEFVAEIE